MQETEHRHFDRPDEKRAFPKGGAEILKTGGGEVGRLVFEPGWRWSSDVKPIAGTDSCLAPHFQYHVSGRLGIRMDDGTEFTAGPGDVTSLPSGHDAWVVGDEQVVVIDWFGATNYARPAALEGPEAVVTAFGAAWADHDLDTALSMLTDDCVFDATGPAPDGAEHKGRDAIRAAWHEIWVDGHVRGADIFKVRGDKISEKLAYVKG